MSFLFSMPLGILKNVKDHIRECAQCQGRRNADDGSGARVLARPGRRRANDEDDEEEEEEADDCLIFTDASSQQRSKLAKTMAKHELVFVSIADLETTTVNLII